MNVRLQAIVLDASIQCRAVIDPQTVTEYAEAMQDGDKFPAVVLFGTAEKCWIGDGWHRVMAAQNIAAETIKAEVRKGGRVDALKWALGANAANGLRRTNQDKRRAVEIALAEFPKLSSRAVAKLCGVSHMTVQRMTKVEQSSTSATVTGEDGKEYPADHSSWTAPEVSGATSGGDATTAAAVDNSEEPASFEATGDATQQDEQTQEETTTRNRNKTLPQVLQQAITKLRTEIDLCARKDWARCDRGELVKQLKQLIRMVK